ncbi:protein with a signal peptide [Cryptosporidium ryanae]|uniref:protein with a signal peptide n=1 Tax=Cryptosporidium ryanae TaxID=515981 RepID=UPI00351A2BF1|nr:protein with a signal peptide [Cryptosporidium ryanae]
MSIFWWLFIILVYFLENEGIICDISLSSSSSGVPCNSGSYTSSSGTCELCPVDTTAATSNLSGCKKCPIFSSTFGELGVYSDSDCFCVEGYYRFEGTTNCVKCPQENDIYICPGKISENYCENNERTSSGGWWMSSPESGIIIRCPNKDSCLSDCTSCKKGYIGPLCNTCSDDHYPIENGYSRICEECPNKYLLLCIFISIIILVLLISYSISRISELSCKYTLISGKKSTVIAKFKIFIFYLSISTTYGMFIYYSDKDLTNMHEFFTIYLKILQFLAANLWLPVGMFPIKCLLKLFPITMSSIGDVNITDVKADLMILSITPIFGVLLLFIVFTTKHIIDVARIYSENERINHDTRMNNVDLSIRVEKFHEILRSQTEKSTYRFITNCQVFLTLIYTPITWTIVNSMICRTIPGYGSVQYQSYILPCNTLNGIALFCYLYYVFFYPFINFISYFFIKNKIIRKSKLYLISSGFLFSGYRLPFLFWESFRFYIITAIIQIMNFSFMTARHLTLFLISVYSIIMLVESVIFPIENSDNDENFRMDKPWWIFSVDLFSVTMISAFSLVLILCLFCIFAHYPNYSFVIEILIIIIHVLAVLFLIQQIFVDCCLLVHRYNEHKQLYGVKEKILDTTESKDGISLYYKHKLGENEQNNLLMGLLKSPFPDEAASQMLYIIEQGDIFDCEAKDVGKLLFNAGFYEPQGQTLRYLIPKIKSYRSNSDIPVDTEIELLAEVRKAMMNTIRILGIEAAVKNAQFRAKGARVIFSSQQFGESTLLKTASDDLCMFLSDIRYSNISENRLLQKNFRRIFPDALPMVYPDDEEFRLRIIDARVIAKDIRKERNKKMNELKSNNMYDKVFGFNIPIRPDVKELLDMKRLNELILPPRWDPLDGRLDHEYDHERYIKVRRQFEDILPIAGTSIISTEEVEKNFMKWYNEGLSIESSKRYDNTSMVGSKYSIGGSTEIHDFPIQNRNGKNFMIVNNNNRTNKNKN